MPLPTFNPNPAQKIQGKKQAGSGFQNLSNLIGANKNAAMGTAMQTGVSNVAKGTQSAIQGAQDETRAKQQAGRVDKETYGSALSSAIAGGNEGEADRVIGAIKAGPTGPQELQNQPALQSSVQRAQDIGRTSTGGLLNRFVAKGPYTVGQRTLDSALLGQNKDAMKQVALGKQQALGTGENLKTAQDVARDQYQQNVAATTAFGEDVKARGSEALKNLQENISATAGQVGHQMKTDLEEVKAAIKSGKMSSVSPGQIQRVTNFLKSSGIDLTQSVADPRSLVDALEYAGGPTNEQVTTDEDVRRAKIFGKLKALGQAPTELGVVKGSEKVDPYKLNKETYLQATTKQASEMAKQAQAAGIDMTNVNINDIDAVRNAIQTKAQGNRSTDIDELNKLENEFQGARKNLLAGIQGRGGYAGTWEQRKAMADIASRYDAKMKEIQGRGESYNKFLKDQYKFNNLSNLIQGKTGAQEGLSGFNYSSGFDPSRFTAKNAKQYGGEYYEPEKIEHRQGDWGSVYDPNPNYIDPKSITDPYMRMVLAQQQGGQMKAEDVVGAPSKTLSGGPGKASGGKVYSNQQSELKKIMDQVNARNAEAARQRELDNVSRGT